MDNMGPGLHEQ